MVCTDKYIVKANSGSGGVGYEKMIVTAELLSHIDSNKIIPIIRQYGTHNVPHFLKTKLFINFSIDDDYEFSFDELARALHGAPLFKKPAIGNNPFIPIEKITPEKTGDALKEFMNIIITDFESGEDYTSYKFLIQRIGISRILLDILIEDAIEQKLIIRDSDGDIWLQAKGKQYAIQHKLIRT